MGITTWSFCSNDWNIAISAKKEEKEENNKKHHIVSKYIKISIITFGILTLTTLLLFITRLIYKLCRISAPRGNGQNPSDTPDVDDIYNEITEIWLYVLSYELRIMLKNAFVFATIFLRFKARTCFCWGGGMVFNTSCHNSLCDNGLSGLSFVW